MSAQTRSMLCLVLVVVQVMMVTSWPVAQDLSWEEPADVTVELAPVYESSSMERIPQSPGPGYEDLTLLLPTTKRAISVLSRWRPFSGGLSRLAGRYNTRTVPRIYAASPDLDFVSAETRRDNHRYNQRPSGQPLRFGR
ncbi:uncharacterized protein [Anabrus simplex]|uniref:uncharacterized protein n=1 Tax=Anabrus simplex TaxID=316456 RepID=UPI0035A29310